MKHSFLFEEGLWITEGTYKDQYGREYAAHGQTTVSHSPNKWKIFGFMCVYTDPATEFFNIYEVEPADPELEYMNWSSVSPYLGELSGHFVIIYDSISSIYTAKSGEFMGTECLRQVSRTCYQNRGVLMGRDIKKSSWSLELKR